MGQRECFEGFEVDGIGPSFMRKSLEFNTAIESTWKETEVDNFLL